MEKSQQKSDPRNIIIAVVSLIAVIAIIFAVWPMLTGWVNDEAEQPDMRVDITLNGEVIGSQPVNITSASSITVDVTADIQANQFTEENEINVLSVDFGVETEKTVLIDVIIGGETVKALEVKTEAANLRQVLEENELVSADEGSFINTVNGRTADWNDGEWWKIVKNGKDALFGASELPVRNGDSFELILTVGW